MSRPKVDVDTKIRQTIEVTILGQRMLLKADEAPRHIERLASYVNRKVDEISAGGAVASTKLALLASLNIANDYFRTLDELREFKRQVEVKSRSLLSELDASIQEVPKEKIIG